MLYAAIGNTWISPATLEVGSGSGLTSTSWNGLLGNFNNLDNRVNTMNSRPVFSAYLNQASSSPVNVWAKVPFNAVDFDTNSFFNTTSNRFQPTIAGYYNITLNVTMNSSTPSGSTIYTALYKNGVNIGQVNNLINYVSTFTHTLNIDSIVYMNGTTDYIDAWYMYNVNTVTLTQ